MTEPVSWCQPPNPCSGLAFDLNFAYPAEFLKQAIDFIGLLLGIEEIGEFAVQQALEIGSFALLEFFEEL